MDLLEVGKIVNTHGLRGEVKVVPWTDYPEQFEDINNVLIKRKSDKIPRSSSPLFAEGGAYSTAPSAAKQQSANGILPGAQYKKLTIRGIKYQKGNIIVRFAEITDINEAEKYKNQILYAERDDLGELPEGVYYIADLIGLTVVTDEGEELGKIADVINTGASDIYEVKREGKKNLLLPAIPDVVLDVDLENKKVTVHMMDGLEDL